MKSNRKSEKSKKELQKSPQKTQKQKEKNNWVQLTKICFLIFFVKKE